MQLLMKVLGTNLKAASILHSISKRLLLSEISFAVTLHED